MKDMFEMKIRVTFTDELLGTLPKCKDPKKLFTLNKFLEAEEAKAAKRGEELPEEIRLRVDEEMAMLCDNPEDLGTTTFAKLDGQPVLLDYYLRGFVKEGLKIKAEFEDIHVGHAKYSKGTCARLVDNYIFVKERSPLLTLPEGAIQGSCVRSIRMMTAQGPRVGIVASDTVPEGTYIEYTYAAPRIDLLNLVEEVLDYGEYKGMGQWRNAGKGRFSWQILSKNYGDDAKAKEDAETQAKLAEKQAKEEAKAAAKATKAAKVAKAKA
jgi:hypothetical protein